jgi:cholesterol oxidase
MPLPPRHRLSEGAEIMESELLPDGVPGFDCDVLIVGSGYGGAVAAARLAGCVEGDRRPSRVWVLERGHEHLPGSFPSRWAELPGQVRLAWPGSAQRVGRAEALYDLRLGSAVATLLGNGLGGGSLINAGVMLMPDADVFAQGWPTGVDAQALQPAFDAALAALAPQVTPQDRTTGKFDLLQALAERANRRPLPEVPCNPAAPPATPAPQAVEHVPAADPAQAAGTAGEPHAGPAPRDGPGDAPGADTDISAQPRLSAERVPLSIHLAPAPAANAAGVTMAPCTRCGDCLTGCNVGAKGSLDTNYLALARARGARLFTGATVHWVQGNDAEGWTVHWAHTASALRHRQQRGSLRARRVVLAAGSLGSTEILLRSAQRQGLELPWLSATVLGSHFSLNGDVIVAGVGHASAVGISADEESDPADDSQRRVGPTITGQIRVPAEGAAPAFRLQDFAVPAALRHVLGEVTAWRTLFGAVDPPPRPGLPDDWSSRLGLADAAVVADHAIERTSLFGAMGRDGADWRLELLEQAEKPPMEGVHLHVHRPTGANALGAIFDRPGEWLDAALGEAVALSASDLPEGLPKWTVHPLGGCRMADHAADGVVNAFGQVFRDDDDQVHRTLAVLDGAIVPVALGVNPALTIAALAEHAVPRLRQDWALLGPPTAAPTAVAARPAPDTLPARRHEIGSRHARWSLRERLQGLVRIGGVDRWARLTMSFEPVPGWRAALQATRRVLNVERAELVLFDVEPGFDAFALDEQRLPPVAARAELRGSAVLSHERNAREAGVTNAQDGSAALTMTYRLAVTAVSGAQRPQALAVGARLQGVKALAFAPETPGPQTNPLRAFTEMDVALDGEALGRLALDLGDLADRDGALLGLRAASNLPDALDDLGALGGYALRQLLQRLLQGDPSALARADNARNAAPAAYPYTQRLPEAWLAGATTVLGPQGDGGWRLCRFPGDGVPVVLIHGLGTAGSMFTHPGIGTPLVQWWRGQGAGRRRDVWVLDLSSSVANARFFEGPAPNDLTVQRIAREEIPAAIGAVCQASRQSQVDVVAHCMGGVMFVLAALQRGNPLEGRIRRAVLSQTGPIVRPSPLNRVRGALADAVLNLCDTLDVLDPTAPPLGLADLLVELAGGLFPYPDDDDFDGKTASMPKAADLRRIRQRADLLFGQLFEAGQMAPAALQALPALFGPIRLRMLAEALNFLQHDMVTEHDGRNGVLRASRVQRQFGFPVLFVHGRRNRVFDWRGALRGAGLVARLRGQAWDDASSSPLPRHRATLWRTPATDPGNPVQLAVFDDHGHLDCMTGKDAHKRVFPVIDAFLDEADGTAASDARRPDPRDLEWPWIGPMLGWVRHRARRHALSVEVVLHPSRRRSGTHGVVVAPLRPTPDGERPDLDRARWLHWPGRGARGWPAQTEDGRRVPAADVQAAALELRIDPLQLQQHAPSRFVLWTVHVEWRGVTAGREAPMPAPAGDWLDGGLPLFAELRTAAALRWQERQRSEHPAPVLTLDPGLTLSADQGRAADGPAAPLRLALASCQYPPLLPGDAGDAAWRRLQALLEQRDAPQLLLLAGDQVYLDKVSILSEGPRDEAAVPSTAVPRLDRDYARSFGMAAVRAVGARLPMWPLPDDHEVHDDWQGQADTRHAITAAALQAYERFQRLLAPGTPLPGPAAPAGWGWRAYPAGVPLYALDTRSLREPRNVTRADAAHIVPTAQLRALVEALAAEPAHSVKLVLSSVPLLPPERAVQADTPATALRSDAWCGFPASAAWLLAELARRRIRGVVLLAGDAHLSSVCTLRLQGPAAASPGDDDVRVTSVVSSGLYTPWPFSNQRPRDIVTDGPVRWKAGSVLAQGRIELLAMSQGQGFATLQLGADDSGAATLRVHLHDADGSVTGCAVPLGLHPAPRPAGADLANAAAGSEAETSEQVAGDARTLAASLQSRALRLFSLTGEALGRAAAWLGSRAATEPQAEKSLDAAPTPAIPPGQKRYGARGTLTLWLKLPNGVLENPAPIAVELHADVDHRHRWTVPKDALAVQWPEGADAYVQGLRLQSDGRGLWSAGDASLRLVLPLRLELRGPLAKVLPDRLTLVLDGLEHALPDGLSTVRGGPLARKATTLVLAASGFLGIIGNIGVTYAAKVDLALDPAWTPDP